MAYQRGQRRNPLQAARFVVHVIQTADLRLVAEMSGNRNVKDLLSDPVLCQQLIGSNISFKLKNDRICGYLKAFDPVSESMIVDLDGDAKYQLVISNFVSDLHFNFDDRIDTYQVDNVPIKLNISDLEVEGSHLSSKDISVGLVE